MATVDSSTTDAELKGLYFDNCGYAEDGSVTKAKAFVTICEALLLRAYRALEVGGPRIEMDPSVIERRLKEAKAFVAANDTGASAARYRHVDFRNFRS